jgi:hypothetical protein
LPYKSMIVCAGALTDINAANVRRKNNLMVANVCRQIKTCLLSQTKYLMFRLILI